MSALKMSELREQARELGIVAPVGTTKEELEAKIDMALGGNRDIEHMIAAREVMPDDPAPNMSIMLEEEPETVPEAVEEAAAPVAPDPAMMAVMAAQMAVQKATEQLAKMQGIQGKPSTPEDVIIKQHESAKAAIAKQEKVPIFIPGGYPGCPKVFPSVVNGHVVKVVPGVEKLVPLAHAENIKMAFAQAQKNMKAQERLEKATKQL